MGKNYLPNSTKGIKPIYTSKKRVNGHISVDVPKNNHTESALVEGGYKVMGLFILVTFGLVGFATFIKGTI